MRGLEAEHRYVKARSSPAAWLPAGHAAVALPIRDVAGRVRAATSVAASAGECMMVRVGGVE
jgi:hypothetical protein